MKKTIYALMSVCLIGGVATGCARQQSAPQAPQLPKQQDIQPPKQSEPQPIQTNTEGGILEEEARLIVLARIPGAQNEHITYIHLDYEDGIQVWEGKVIYNEMKYEFDITVSDGTVYEWDMESVYDD